jgi:hypothetical protein
MRSCFARVTFSLRVAPLVRVATLIRVATPFIRVATLCIVMATAGCASLLSSVTGDLAENLALAILESDDPDTVREAIPAYLLLIDSFLRDAPENPAMLTAASELNGAFASFVDTDRAGALSQKSLRYALRAACVRRPDWCEVRSLGFAAFKERFAEVSARDVDVIYRVGVSWAGWVQANAGDWNAIADLSKVRFLIERVLSIDETHDDGGAHLYLAVLDTLLPALSGGRPEEGRRHFDRSIELAGGRFLMTKVLYAEQYARLVFDKALHDRLLTEVLAAAPEQPRMTLANVVAQRRAKNLLAESNDYF